MNEPIKVGYQTYIYDGGEEFGAVREVSPDGTQLVVYIENAGEFVIPIDTVKSAHSGKVIGLLATQPPRSEGNRSRARR